MKSSSEKRVKSIVKTWVIGDIQGCYKELQELLDKIGPAHDDELIFCGDLINRGPASLQTLQFVFDNQKTMRTVLGNHDLHMLALWHTHQPLRTKDTFDDIFAASHAEELLAWLIQQPLLIHHAEQASWITHAGIPHLWSLPQAQQYALEIENVLQDTEKSLEFFNHMYGNTPAIWSDKLSGSTRWRVITNYLTRMRFIRADGFLDLKNKGTPSASDNAEFQPWFNFRAPSKERIVFGHWAALNGATHRDDIIGTDTGSVWGNKLTAYCLQSRELVSVS